MSQTPKLIECWVSNNNLTQVDINNCPLLEKFGCHHNKISNLDLSHNSKLIQLLCYENSLSMLDLSNNPNIYTPSFDCGNQTISSFNVTSKSDSEYPYIFAVSDFGIYASNYSNVSEILAKDSSNKDINTDYDAINGLIRLAAIPASMSYIYKVAYAGKFANMNVSVSKISEGESSRPIINTIAADSA